MDPERLASVLSAWIAPALVATAVIVGAAVGLGPALLVLAGSVLVGVVALLWTSLGRLTGDASLTIEEALGFAAPSPEEERKQSIVRALKDLEYERSVGKISDQDYHQLSARYRAEAKALLKSIDEANAPRWEQAEALLAERLKREGLASASAPSVRGRPAASKPPPAARTACAACATENDEDARFCKRCGASMGPSEGTP